MKPQFLQSNDKIAIVAPSGRVFKEDLVENLEFIQSHGLNPVLGENLFEDFYEGYHYAGSITQRISDFQQALDDEEIKAIWCARGGYGAVQLLDQLNWTKFKENPKWIIGYSDITAFHNHVNNWGIASIHGITVKRLNSTYSNETFKTLISSLFGEHNSYEIPSPPFNKYGKAKGILVGGNLSIICSLMGSKSSISGDNQILFIEDWNENWYQLNRMMMNLKRSGVLNNIKGLIVGSFTKMDLENENQNFNLDFDETSNQIISTFMEEYNIPICFQFPSGHIGDNRALIMGTEIQMDISQNYSRFEF